MEEENQTSKVVKTIAGDFDIVRYKRLRIDYNTAVDRGDNMFEFDGEKFLTQFGKYLLDFLSTQFEDADGKI